MTDDPAMTAPEAGTDERHFVGRFVRKQGNFGTVAVVGRRDVGRVEPLADPKRLFPKDGLVETHGVFHARLARGDWVEFDLVRNSRPRAPAYRATHLRRLARYAVLPESTVAGYRVLLTKDGWRGESRPGTWALRTSGDRLLVADLELGKDGALRIPRKLAREVHWTEYRNDLIVQMPVEGGTEQVFAGDLGNAGGIYDWSEEADHVARVIRSLSDANDPRLADLIAWLELHHEEGTGRVFAAAADHEAAEAALRSGELAERLRVDQDLMAAYVEAAQVDDAVRGAIRAWAREGRVLVGEPELLDLLVDPRYKDLLQRIALWCSLAKRLPSPSLWERHEREAAEVLRPMQATAREFNPPYSLQVRDSLVDVA